MMKRATIASIVGFLNKTLRVRTIRDASVNGLQVRLPAATEITRVGFAVDACLSTFEKADRLAVDLLVVHHGIKWRPQKDHELERRRAAYLTGRNMALYAAHLPLDLHAEYGNNIQLCRMLGVRDLRRFGRYHGIRIGYAGRLDKAAALDTVSKKLGRQLRSTCRLLRFGKDRVRSVAIVSGGGGSMLNEAWESGIDCFIVGEVDLAVYNAARDKGMNVIAAGHYATETAGVRALMRPVNETFGVSTVFVNDPKDL
jgi:dinuclear metal center YbgI/SA1388 family protein